MSRDPFPGYVTLSISQNPYAYAHTNPINGTDPTGRCFEPLSATACLAYIGGVAIVGTIGYLIGQYLVHNPPNIYFPSGQESGAIRRLAEQCNTIIHLLLTQTQVQRRTEDEASDEVQTRPEPRVAPTPVPTIVPVPVRTPDPHYDLALGLFKNLGGFTASIQQKTGIPTYHFWNVPEDSWEMIGKNSQGDYLQFNSKMGSTAYKVNFGILLNNFFKDSPTGLIRFNLEDMEKDGVSYSSATQWELEYILSNPIALNRTKFYEYFDDLIESQYKEVSILEAKTRIP